MLVLCATAKDGYRKPSTGAWRHLGEEASDGVRPDLASSFYVGDAAGRPGDHSDTDREFASAVGVRFHTETEFFKEIHKA
jgi:bifunctional polynucleotide phosphatase/kinase